MSSWTVTLCVTQTRLQVSSRIWGSGTWPLCSKSCRVQHGCVRNWTSRSICLHWNRSMYGPCCWNWGSKSLRGMGGHAGCRKSCILCLWSLCPFVSFGKKELGFCLAFQSTRYLFWKYNIVFFFGSMSMFKEFCWIWMHQRKIQDI